MLKTDDPGAGRRWARIAFRSGAASPITPTAPAAIASLLIGGPYDAKVPQDSPSRQLLFVCHPAAAADEASLRDEDSVELARRAYRRAATDDDVQTLLGFYKHARADGSFDDGIRAALERVLVSPDFLFRIEADPGRAAPGTLYRISDVELASRLSFALWSSIPDDSCSIWRSRASCTNLRCSKSRSRACSPIPARGRRWSQNFFAEWLQTRNVWLLNPESTKFPWFDDNLRFAFVNEIGDVSRRAAERGPQHRRSADLERDLPQRTTGAALRNSRRLRQPFPAA